MLDAVHPGIGAEQVVTDDAFEHGSRDRWQLDDVRLDAGVEGCGVRIECDRRVTLPVAREEIVIEDVDEHTAESPLLGSDARATAPDHRMSVGKRIDRLVTRRAANE